MSDVSCGTAYIGAGAALLGALIGAGTALVPTWWQKRKRHRAYWAALSAEVDICSIYARAYAMDNVASPLYRMPTVAYTEGFTGLLADGSVSRAEAAAILGFYGMVEQFNRGADQAHAAKLDDRGDVWLHEEAGRLLVKARAIGDAQGAYRVIRAVIEKHIEWTPAGV